MWHWTQDEIALMRQKIREGYRWASRGLHENVLTFHRNPIEVFFMGDWCSAGSTGDYQEVKSKALPHLLNGQYVDMAAAVNEDMCPNCGKGKMIFSPVLLHQMYCKHNQSVFSRRWECPVCGTHGELLYSGKLNRLGY